MPEQPGAPPNFRRPRHRLVWQMLESLNGDLLARAKCWFGGGTRVAMELGEFRESVDVDFLCENRKGYRILRSTVTRSSLGDLASRPVELMRDVRADMYGIRTFLRVDGQPVKFEMIFEGRIPLTGEVRSPFPVEVLARRLRGEAARQRGPGTRPLGQCPRRGRSRVHGRKLAGRRSAHWFGYGAVRLWRRRATRAGCRPVQSERRRLSATLSGCTVSVGYGYAQSRVASLAAALAREAIQGGEPPHSCA